jgi:hypothetical protein
LLASPEKIALQRLILAARPKKTIGCTKIPALPGRKGEQTSYAAGILWLRLAETLPLPAARSPSMWQMDQVSSGRFSV